MMTLAEAWEAFAILTGGEMGPARGCGAGGERHDSPRPPLEGKARVWALKAAEKLPNDDLHWEEWSRVGMALWSATAGEGDGYAAFVRWSEKSDKHDEAACWERWQHWTNSSPPTELDGWWIINATGGPPAEEVFDVVEAVTVPEGEPEATATDRGPVVYSDIDAARKLLRHWHTSRRGVVRLRSFRERSLVWRRGVYGASSEAALHTDAWQFLEGCALPEPVEKDDGDE